MDNLITIVDWFSLDGNLENEITWGSCSINVNNRPIELTLNNTVGGLFVKQISYKEYIDRKLQGFPVKKTKHKYWCLGLNPEIKEEVLRLSEGGC